MSNTYYFSDWWATNSTNTTTSSLTYQTNTKYWVNYPVASAPAMAVFPEAAALPAKAEDPMSWLRRRVDEIAWVPE